MPYPLVQNGAFFLIRL